MKKIKKTTIKRESFLIRLRPETLARVRGIAAQRQIPAAPKPKLSASYKLRMRLAQSQE